MKKFFSKVVPLWLVLMIVIDTTLLSGLAQYYLMKWELKQAITQLAKTTQTPEQLAQILKQEVLPQKGYMTSLKWKDLMKKLIEAGTIDKQKYGEEITYLETDPDSNIEINEINAHFMVNTLWALGLVNKSKVLDEGPMKGKGIETGKMASTGGWTLGSKDAMELYSSAQIIPLTPEQQELVKKIAENVFRPCCGNSTYFPDCNHGMAALGYIELAVYNGLSEGQIYKDLLAFNSYWFPQNYVEMAVYFEKQGIKWKDVDPKLALSANYSSAQGTQRIKQSIQSVPGTGGGGRGCSV